MTKGDIQLIRSLDDKRSRTESGLFVAEGGKLVRELLASDFRVRKVYYTGDEAVDFPKTCSERVAPKDMERASRLKTPTDVLALVEIPRITFDPADLRGHLTLALDGVQNPGNVGTIIRLADWFGITDVLCSDDSADCWNPKVVQATMGAITRVRVHYGDLAAMISPASLPVYGTFLEGDNIYEASLDTEGIVVMGSEGRGISDSIERLVTRKIFIPPFPADRAGSESLNVSVAAAITISEFRRPR